MRNSITENVSSMLHFVKGAINYYHMNEQDAFMLEFVHSTNSALRNSVCKLADFDDYESIQAGNFTPRMSVFNIRDTLLEILHAIRAQAHMKKIVFLFTLDDYLPMLCYSDR